MSKEDEYHVEAWKTVSIDPITGTNQYTDTNQNTDTYSGRIKTVLNEHKLVDPNFANIHMDRGEKAMANRWSTIQTACNKWHAIVEEVAARPKNDANVEGQVWSKVRRS
ncbi:putative methionyl-tRNA synthetase [Hordeum vulgare]|nr:putative methionyl-tRNA synthetase [Hordeum vulgare]